MGRFSDVIGKTNRNLVLEVFMQAQELDFGLGDVTRELSMPKSTVNANIKKLLSEGFITQTRTLGNKKMYKLNQENKDVQTLKTVFDTILIELINDEDNATQEIRGVINE